MAHTTPLCAGTLLTLSMCASAADGFSHQKTTWELKPVVLDSKSSASSDNGGNASASTSTGGTTVGLEYKIAGKLSYSLDSPATPGKPNFEDAVLNDAVLAYNASGTVAADKQKNPKNFLEFQLDGGWQLSPGRGIGTLLTALTAKYEASQGFDKKQSVIGATITYTNRNLPFKNDQFGLDAAYGKVDPKKDPDRLAALGTTSLDTYYRWDFEANYKHIIAWKPFDTIELDYRYFREAGAPEAIKTAHLDVHRLGTIRLGLVRDMYIAYSKGKLPFEIADQKIYELGFSYKLD